MRVGHQPDADEKTDGQKVEGERRQDAEDAPEIEVLQRNDPKAPVLRAEEASDEESAEDEEHQDAQLAEIPSASPLVLEDEGVLDHHHQDGQPPKPIQLREMTKPQALGQDKRGRLGRGVSLAILGWSEHRALGDQTIEAQRPPFRPPTPPRPA